MKKMIKIIVFAVIIILLVFATGAVIKTGKFQKLEGYMYSFATEITNSATDCNATSSNAPGCATPSNALECATPANATSSDITINKFTQTATPSDVSISNKQDENVCATSSNSSTIQEIDKDDIQVSSDSKNIEEILEKDLDRESKQDTEEHVETIGANYESKKQVSFLESNKMYVTILGVSVLAIVIVAIILSVDKKAIAKRKAKANNKEEK